MENEAQKIEERKETLKMPKSEHFPYALVTGAYILFACGLLLLMQGQWMNKNEAVTQAVTFVASVAVFCLGGFFLHAYFKWMLKDIHVHAKQ